MVKWHIGTYARLRPLGEDMTVPSLISSRMHLKQRDGVDFHFNDVFDPSVSQEQVFNEVCLDIVYSALDGYNGTILAYGQTGSGKTYTITGGEHYADRGIIPIYNENVYDLLDRSHTDRPIEEWTKVLLMDDDEGDMHFRNLGVFEAVSEEEALNLLFLGNMNRVTSDTPMNQVAVDIAVNTEVDTEKRLETVEKLNAELETTNLELQQRAVQLEKDIKDQALHFAKQEQQWGQRLTLAQEETQAALAASKSARDRSDQNIDWMQCEEIVRDCYSLVIYHVKSSTNQAVKASSKRHDFSELQELMTKQTRTVELLEQRLLEQKREAELLKDQIQRVTESQKSEEPKVSIPRSKSHSGALRKRHPSGRSVGDRDSVTTMSGSDLIRKRMEILRNGSLFVKYGRYGKPHHSTKGDYPTRSIVGICIGQETRVFERAKQPERAPHCFSVEYDENARWILRLPTRRNLLQNSKPSSPKLYLSFPRCVHVTTFLRALFNFIVHLDSKYSPPKLLATHSIRRCKLDYFLSFVAAHHQPSIVMISDQGDQTKVITFGLRGGGFVPVGVVTDTIDAKNNNVKADRVQLAQTIKEMLTNNPEAGAASDGRPLWSFVARCNDPRGSLQCCGHPFGGEKRKHGCVGWSRCGSVGCRNSGCTSYSCASPVSPMIPPTMPVVITHAAPMIPMAPIYTTAAPVAALPSTSA
ncbi:Kinesin-like protein [Phytophthora cactorum]|nr:Kinesin-like protein [Phytophthora cactorum]